MTVAAAPQRYKSGERVALFLPCYADVAFPEIGRAMVVLFERLGVPLEYPMEQTCCGQPAFNAGYRPEAKALAEHFAAAFDGFDWIVVPSGSCAAMCKVFYPMLEPGAGAIETGARVCELSTFLVDALGTTDVGARFPHTLTYHDGCHGRRELKVGDAPLRLLRAVKDATLVELPAVEECCGFGGLFSVKFDELSASMGDSKCENVRASGADVLVSGDPSCLAHIGGMLARNPATRSIRTLHLAQVLASV
jgi:L-lactate dehydrogenase complex protein LldE